MELSDPIERAAASQSFWTEKRRKYRPILQDTKKAKALRALAEMQLKAAVAALQESGTSSRSIAEALRASEALGQARAWPDGLIASSGTQKRYAPQKPLGQARALGLTAS
jgi:hypothetical protein